MKRVPESLQTMVINKLIELNIAPPQCLAVSYYQIKTAREAVISDSHFKVNHPVEVEANKPFIVADQNSPSFFCVKEKTVSYNAFGCELPSTKSFGFFIDHTNSTTELKIADAELKQLAKCLDIRTIDTINKTLNVEIPKEEVRMVRQGRYY